jgi:hypothetical protein
MYGLMLALHSVIRWVVLACGAIAVLRAVLGWSGRRPWTASDDRAGLWLTIAMDVQTLVGLLLYAWLSPITTAALADMGAAMSIPSFRFWAVEHLALMVVALVLVHMGRVFVRKARTDAARHRRAAIFFLLALAAVLGAIPWPGSANGRPVIRLTF